MSPITKHDSKKKRERNNCIYTRVRFLILGNTAHYWDHRISILLKNQLKVKRYTIITANKPHSDYRLYLSTSQNKTVILKVLFNAIINQGGKGRETPSQQEIIALVILFINNRI